MKPIKLVLIWCSSCGRTRRRTVGKILTLRFKCLWLTVMVEDVDEGGVDETQEADERNVSLNLATVVAENRNLNQKRNNRKRNHKRKRLEKHLEDERKNRNQHVR